MEYGLPLPFLRCNIPHSGSGNRLAKYSAFSGIRHTGDVACKTNRNIASTPALADSYFPQSLQHTEPSLQYFFLQKLLSEMCTCYKKSETVAMKSRNSIMTVALHDVSVIDEKFISAARWMHLHNTRPSTARCCCCCC